MAREKTWAIPNHSCQQIRYRHEPQTVPSPLLLLLSDSTHVPPLLHYDNSVKAISFSPRTGQSPPHPPSNDHRPTATFCCTSLFDVRSPIAIRVLQPSPAPPGTSHFQQSSHPILCRSTRGSSPPPSELAAKNIFLQVIKGK